MSTITTNITNWNNRKTRQKLSIFLICVIISSSIWFLVKLSDNYTATYTYRIIYKNLPTDKILINDTDSFFSLNVKTTGFKSITHINDKQPVTIDASLLKLKQKNNLYVGYLLTAKIINEIVQQTDIHAENVLSVTPDTLTFIYKKLVRKKVPVKLNISLAFEKQYHLYDSVTYEPDSIWISGSDEEVIAIHQLQTENKHLTGLNKNTTLFIPILKPDKSRLTFSPDRIKANLRIDEYTEASIILPIIIRDVPNKYNFKIFPEKVEIIYRVALRDYKKISSDMFAATVTYPRITDDKQNTVKINILRQPDFAKITRINPEEVEYIILK